MFDDGTTTDGPSAPTSVTLLGWVRKRRWTAMAATLYAFTIVLPAMDRYFTWDEAVFFSQSGGLNGATVEPMTLVASREIGSPLLIGLLRTIAQGLAEVRFLWATLTVALLVLGARRLVRHIGDRGALVFLAVYGSYWLVMAFAPAFYGNALFAVLALLGATYYLDLLAEPPSARPLRIGALVGLSVGGAFAMRPLEAVLLVFAMVLHLGALNARILPRLLKPLGLAGLVAIASAGIPWMMDSVDRFGSVLGRVEAALGQGGQVASGLRFNLDDYLGVWVGDYVAQLPLAPVPYWPRWIIYTGMVISVVAIAVALFRASPVILRKAPGLFLVAGLVHASFFLFWRAPIADRYHFGSMIFAAALLGWAASKLAPSELSRKGIAGLAVGAVIWLTAQVVLITSYDAIRTASSDQAARVAVTMRTLANDGPCRAMSRYGAPQLAIASGCRVGGYTEWTQVLDGIDTTTDDVPFFVYGPASTNHFEGFGENWHILPIIRAGDEREFRLAYRLTSRGDGE